MFYKNLLLTALAVTPSLNAVPVCMANQTAVTTDIKDEQTEEKEACTFMYVGKKVSDTGRAYIARTSDAGPRGMNVNTRIFQHNELANQTIKGINGFEWTMPSTTYRYVSTPKNKNLKANYAWEVSAMNENGVCVSATLSCQANDKAIAADPLREDTGITEDNITQIVGATATSARNGIETIAKIIDQKGNGEFNAIMILDKDEAWYMEMYTGQQYLAIKMPEDKCCTIGNEFNLNTIYELGLGEDDYIASENLLSKAVDNHFAVFDSTGIETLEHLHLYNTYAGEGTPGTFIDGCHMRTWRGLSLFTDNAPKYETTKKYPAFFTPNRKLGVKDIITFMRDRFEDILIDPNNENYPYFIDVYNKGELRCVGVDMAYQVHVMSLNPDLPTELSGEEWLALSNSCYTPFIPVCSGITRFDEYYSHESENYGWDEKAAGCLFRRLSALADVDRVNYGIPTQTLVSDTESMWMEQYEDLLAQIKTLSLPVQQNVLTNYSCELQKQSVEMSKMLFDDLMWHIINPITDPKITDKSFKPLINLEYYCWNYGWNYGFDSINNVATLTDGDNTVKVDYNYTKKPKWGWIIGKVTKNDEEPVDVALKMKDGIPYMDYATAQTYLADGHEVKKLKWQDYYFENKNSNAGLITVEVMLIVAAMCAPIIPAAINSRRKRKLV